MSINQSLDNHNPFGIKPYVRKDYVYSQDFCSLKDNQKIESVFSYSEINHWESNLINFLKGLANSEE